MLNTTMVVRSVIVAVNGRDVSTQGNNLVNGSDTGNFGSKNRNIGVNIYRFM